jgi:hypothetical protein
VNYFLKDLVDDGVVVHGDALVGGFHWLFLYMWRPWS